MDTRINNGIHFKSGLTPKILRMEKNIKPKIVEKYFFNLPTKDPRSFYLTDLKNNKAMATANRLCADIFSNLRRIFDYRAGYCSKNLLAPQDLYVYNKEDSEFYKNLEFFSLGTQFAKIEKNKPVFELGTVFMPNSVNKLENLDAWNEYYYKIGATSTPHFMNTIVHEWLHAIFDKTLDNICFENEFNFNRTYDLYSSKKLTKKEKEIVADVISTYPVSCDNNQYAETFACSWTKFICDSLADDCRTFKQNPLDIMKSTPKEFQKILKKVSNVEFVNYGGSRHGYLSTVKNKLDK